MTTRTRTLTLYDRTIHLVEQYRALADHYDACFERDADPRAIQGGAYCGDAAELRDLADQLREIAEEVQNFQI